MSAITVWTFITATFTRILTGGGDFEPWFQSKKVIAKDLVLGATVASDSYLDIGATEVSSLTIRANFTNEIDRDAFLALLGDQGTLSNTRGRTGSAVLVDAKRIDSGMRTRFYVDAIFEQRG